MTTETINWQPQHLEDNLVKLIPLNPTEFESLYRSASDPLIWEQHPANNRYQREVFQQFFDEAIASGTAFKITENSTGNVIGCTRFYDYQPQNSSIAIGYTFLAREYWGGQYNRSTKALLLNYAFQYVDNIFFHIGATNIRSQAATAKFGARKAREMYLDNNPEKPYFEYVLQKHSWQNEFTK